MTTPEVAALEQQYRHVPPPPHATVVGPWIGESLSRMFLGSCYGPPGATVIRVYGRQRVDGTVQSSIVVEGCPSVLTAADALKLALALDRIDPTELEGLEGAPPMPKDALADCLIVAAREACGRCSVDDGRAGEEFCMH